MSWFRIGLRTKLFVAIITTAILVTAIMAGMIGWSFRNGLARYFLNVDMTYLAPVMAELVKDYDETAGGWPQLEQDPNELSNYTEQILRKYRPKPGSFRRAPANGKASKVENPTRRPRNTNQMKTETRVFLLDPAGNLVAGRRDPIEGAIIEPLKIPTSASEETIIGYFGVRAPSGANELAMLLYIDGLLRNLFWIVIFVLFSSVIVALILSKQLTRPLQILTRKTRLLAKGDFSLRMNSLTKDEVGDLIIDFNTLAQSLDNAKKAEREWVTATSHELKTPLSLLQKEISALKDGMKQVDQGTFSTLHSITMRVSEMVDALSLISYAREGKLVRLLDEEDISQLTSSAVEHCRSQLEETGFTVQASIQTGIIGDVDPTRFRQLIRILTESARQKAAPPGTVSISLSMTGNETVLSVSDSGPALALKEVEHLFEKLNQTDDHHRQSFGDKELGLQVCHAIVVGHGGKMTVGVSELGGLTITASFSNHSEDTYVKRTSSRSSLMMLHSQN